MKKFLVTILALIVASCCLLFTGCSVSGEYKFHSATYENDDNLITVGIGEKFEGITLTEDFVSLKFDGDKVILRQKYTKTHGDESEEYKEVYIYNYIENGDEIYIYKDGDSDAMILAKDGNTIVFGFYDLIVTLKK